MQPTTPLYQALAAHQKKGRASFHTPGHKGREGIFPPDLLSLDVTELPDTDSLFEAGGPILQAEQEAAQVLGTAHTFFSAGGCTLCILAMLRLASLDRPPGKRKILAGRVLHRSAVQGMALLDLEPVWVLPRQDAGQHLAGRVHPEDVEAVLCREGDSIAAVYVTSPDYFGVLADIPGISAVCRRYDVPLLVDNAHGAHLFFTSPACHPLREGADMTACSAHKTLPVLTGGAWLNLADGKYAPFARDAMALFASTSPSYLILTSLDLCTRWAQDQARPAMQALQEKAAQVRCLAEDWGFVFPQGRTDPVRLALDVSAYGISGETAAEHFRGKGVEPEYADGTHVILIPTPMTREEEWARVEDALRSMPQGKAEREFTCPLPPLPPVVCSPREAVLRPSERIPLEQAVGRIAADPACPCPPGIPVVMPGERVTPEAAGFLQKYRFFTLRVVQ